MLKYIKHISRGRFFLRAFTYANICRSKVIFHLHENLNIVCWCVHMIVCRSTVLYATDQHSFGLRVVFWVQFLLWADMQWPISLHQEVCDAVDIIVTFFSEVFFCFCCVNVILVLLNFFKRSLSVNRRFGYRENLFFKM